MTGLAVPADDETDARSLPATHSGGRRRRARPRQPDADARERASRRIRALDSGRDRWAGGFCSGLMTYLARATPELPASVEFSPSEIRAAALLVGKRRVRVATVTMKTITNWLATVGGYIDRKSALPPGLIVLTRGLRLVESAALALRTQEGIGEAEE